MKKILCLLCIASIPFMTSCSNDDDNDNNSNDSELRATIDGTEYLFDEVTVEETEYPAEGYTDLQITAAISNDPTRTISMIVTEDALGEASWYFTYFLNLSPFQKVTDEFTTNITENSGSHVVGTFNGNVTDLESGETLTITNGSLDVSY